MRNRDKRVALVTGAGAGIGRATAIAFASQGISVVVADIDGASAADTADAIAAIGHNAMALTVDVSDAGQVEALLAATLKRYGQIDFAFNNAGIEGELANTVDCAEENWDRVQRVNLKSIWLCMKYELRHMLARKAGVIVNCASVAGLAGVAGLPAYVASKHGVVGLTRTAALECAADGIRVNAVCPGVIHTAMVDRLMLRHPGVDFAAREPMQRMGTPHEVAAAVTWLCSDGASFVTGQAIAVDGGFLAQ